MFKLLLIFFSLFSYSTYGTELVDSVVPYLGEVNIENGEIYKVEIRSEKGQKELESFKNQKINDIMYVLDFKQIGNVAIFEVFVTSPPKSEEDKLETISFPPLGFQYKFVKKNDQGDLTSLDFQYSLNKKKEGFYLWALLILILLLGCFAFVIYRFIKKQKAKKRAQQKRREEGENLLKLFEKANSRSDFEEIYRKRKVILERLDLNDESFKICMGQIDKIQYREIWSEEELESIRKMVRPFKNSEINCGV